MKILGSSQKSMDKWNEKCSCMYLYINVLVRCFKIHLLKVRWPFLQNDLIFVNEEVFRTIVWDSFYFLTRIFTLQCSVQCTQRTKTVKAKEKKKALLQSLSTIGAQLFWSCIDLPWKCCCTYSRTALAWATKLGQQPLGQVEDLKLARRQQ